MGKGSTYIYIWRYDLHGEWWWRRRKWRNDMIMIFFCGIIYCAIDSEISVSSIWPLNLLKNQMLNAGKVCENKKSVVKQGVKLIGQFEPLNSKLSRSKQWSSSKTSITIYRSRIEMFWGHFGKTAMLVGHALCLDVKSLLAGRCWLEKVYQKKKK